MLPLKGKGLWIRRISECENGDLDAIVAKAQAAAYTHLLLKIADGADVYNIDWATGHDAAAELTRRLREAGINVWGWQALYGDKPLFKGALQADYHLHEARCAVERVARLQPAGLQGYVISAEGDYERAVNRAAKAARFMQIVRESLPDFPIALASWKYPNTHPRFPWKEFRGRCDLDMPQVYWIGRHGEAARQLETSLRQFAALEPRRPYVPTGPAFLEGNWRPAPEDMVAFLEKAISLGLPAANLWGWDHLALTGGESYNPKHLDFSFHWKAAADFVWTGPAAMPFRIRVPEAAAAPEPVTAPMVEPALAATQEFGPELELLLDLEPEDELPEWLQFLKEPEAPGEAALTPYAAAELLPELGLLDLEPEDELPEWLQFLKEPEAPGIPALTSYVAAELPPEPVALSLDLEPEDELPEWLQFLKEPEVTAPQSEAQAAAGPLGALPAASAPATPAIVEAAPVRRAASRSDTVHWLFDALRRGKIEEAVALYAPSFALVNSERVERDPAAVLKFYRQLLQHLDRQTLNVLSLRGSRAAVSVRWAARTLQGASRQGVDAFHLNREGQIVYHHTTFRIETE